MTQSIDSFRRALPTFDHGLAATRFVHCGAGQPGDTTPPTRSKAGKILVNALYYCISPIGTSFLRSQHKQLSNPP